jgi:hypothetical protein
MQQHTVAGVFHRLLAVTKHLAFPLCCVGMYRLCRSIMMLKLYVAPVGFLRLCMSPLLSGRHCEPRR